MVKRSSSPWVGCAWRPSPAFTTCSCGLTWRAMRNGAPEEAWRTTKMSACIAERFATVSSSDSPLLAEETAMFRLMTSAERRFAAISKVVRVRVERDARRAAVIEDLVHRGAHRAAAVEDVVDEEELRAVHVERDLGALGVVLQAARRVVVAIKSDVHQTERLFNPQIPMQSFGEPRSPGVETHHRGLRPDVRLQLA